MLVVWIVLGWAVLAALTVVVFAAVGRSAHREDEALGYTRDAQPDPGAEREPVPVGSPAAR